ncbi:hypothetical protein IW150_001577 [Coemansia sp. RSA 2607]|nr:hypothetical protein IW150_001577 [Coemansia sp. RSA 2607]
MNYQAILSKREAQAEAWKRHIRDVHLAMVFERIGKDPLAISSLFDLTSYVSELGNLHVVVRGMVLGPEWTVTDLTMMRIPQAVEAHVDSIHVDILDALQPCAADTAEQHLGDASGPDAEAEYSVPHLCELWIVAAHGSSRSTAAIAPELLSALLFEKLPPQSAHSKVAAVMISPTMAEFCVPDQVNVMCVCEADRLALRMSSHSHTAYVSVVVAVIKRLALLLDVDLENTETAGGVAGILSKRSSELGNILRGKSAEPTTNHVDFAVIKCAVLDSIFKG